MNANRQQMHKRRQLKNRLALALSAIAMVIGVFWLIWILWQTFYLGLSNLTWASLTQMTPPPQETTGGLANAIVGSAIMAGLATLIGTPIGVMAGVFLSEYAGRSWSGRCLRMVNDILLSAPSIVIGLFIYSVWVSKFKTFSGFAGVLALSLIVIPVVVRTTESMLSLVQNQMREAAHALGSPKWLVISKITLKSARAGILTGILLAIARITGETAPLLFTALSNQFWSTDISQPMASLPVTIFKFAMSPYENWQQLAWVGVMIITLTVLALNILARRLNKS